MFWTYDNRHFIPIAYGSMYLNSSVYPHLPSAYFSSSIKFWDETLKHQSQFSKKKKRYAQTHKHDGVCES